MKIEIIFTILFLLLFTNIILAGWQQTYDWGDNDYASDIVSTIDGGYVITGYTYSYSSDGLPYGFLMKIDNSGEIIWEQIYEIVEGQWLTSVTAVEDGYIAAGYERVPAGGEDILVIKTDLDGEMLWSNTYHNGTYQEAQNVIQLQPSGEIIVVGYTEVDNHNWWVLCLQDDGDTLWTREIGDENWDIATAVVQANDNPDEFIVIGYKEITLYTDEDFWAVRMDIDGDELWSETYGGDSYDEPYAITSVGDNYIIAGKTQSYGAGSYDAYLMCINNDGDTIWTNTYGFDSFDGANSAIATYDGDVAITGFQTDSLSRDIFLAKFSATDGSLQWSRTFGGDATDEAVAITNSPYNGFVIAGNSNSFGSNYDIIAINTDSLGFTGIEKERNYPPKEFRVKIYPNPFNSSCAISAPENAQMQIYDLRGNIIYTFEPHPLGCGQKTPTFIWQPDENISTGIYIAKVISDDNTITKKLIYIR